MYHPAKSSIFTIYNRARKVARRVGTVDEKRLNRALGIALNQERFLNLIEKYETSIQHCNCPDNLYHTSICKHRLAMMIIHRASQLEKVSWDEKYFYATNFGMIVEPMGWRVTA